jgi:hypothetical protein
LFQEDGQLWELGLVGKGQVAALDTVEPSLLPKPIKTPLNVKFTSVSAGDYHAVAIAGLYLFNVVSHSHSHSHPARNSNSIEDEMK